MTKIKYLFPALTSILRFTRQSSISTLGAVVILLSAHSTALATYSNQQYFEKNDYTARAYYNLITSPSYNPSNNLNSTPSSTIQLCQYDQGLQSGHVDHLGQSDLEIYTNEQGDEVMRTVPKSQESNGGQGNIYYISPQIYPMPNPYPPPNFKPEQRAIPRPKP